MFMSRGYKLSTMNNPGASNPRRGIAKRCNISVHLVYISYTIGSEVPIRHWFTVQQSLVHVAGPGPRAHSLPRPIGGRRGRTPPSALYLACARIYHTSRLKKGFLQTYLVFVIVTEPSEAGLRAVQ